MSGADESTFRRTSPFRPVTASLVRRFADSRLAAMFLVLSLLAIYFHIATHGIFFSPRNLSLLLRQGSIAAVAASGVSILIVMGEIDLSIGSAVYLCSVIAASLQANAGMATLPTVLLTLLAGLAMAAWQGFWVVEVAVPSFVVTLSGLLAFRGIGYYVSDARTIAPISKSFSFLSEGFIPPTASYFVLAMVYAVAAALLIRAHRRRRQDGDTTKLAIRLTILLGSGLLLAWIFCDYLGIPSAMLWVAAIGIVLTILMDRTKFGRNTYLIGSNREAAVLAGIPLARHLFLGFLLMGALYGVAGVLITSRLGAATPSSGQFLELDAIAGAVIGGTSLRGGVGSVAGAMAGALLLTTIDNGMSLLNVSSFIQLVIKGLVLLAALSIDAYMIKHRRYRR
jgi:D-xylose transport system permease protein